MSYAFVQDMPIDSALYRRVRAGLGDEPPQGLIVHLAVERPEGGLRYLRCLGVRGALTVIDVWVP